MKTFFIFFLKNYLSIPLLGIGMLIIALLINTEIRHSELSTSYKGNVNSYAWVGKINNCKGFILGSSTLRYGLSSKELSNNDSIWINFSMDARDPIEMYLLLEKYYSILKPNTILIGLDPWIYSKDYYQYRHKVMYLDLNKKELWNFLNNDYLSFFYKLKYLVNRKIFVPSFNLIQNLQNSSVIPEDYGSAYINKTALNFKDLTKDRFMISKTGWSETQFYYLKKIRDFCKKYKIRSIFLIPPKRLDYINITKKKFKNENEEWWLKANKILSESEVLSNYFLFSKKNSDSLFADAFHLNKKGRSAFSEYVKINLSNTKLFKHSSLF